MNNFESDLARNLGVRPRGTVLLAAVSGGADSTAMLAALSSLREERDFVLRCIHVNHGIRSPRENSRDEEAVRSLCGVFGLPFTTARVKPGRIALRSARWGEGLEAAARKYRHAALRREARRTGASRILIAHTRDDSLEKILMAMLRGGGPAALAGMPLEKGGILRPLITLTRAQVLEYLAGRGLSYCSDSTNADTAYLRNRVRLALVPLLDERFPGWRKALLELGRTQALIAAALEKAAGELPWTGDDKTLSLPEKDFFCRDEIVREEILYRGIDSLGMGQVRRESLRLFSGGKLQSMDLGQRGRVRKIYRLERKQGSVVLSVVRKGSGGFALLIEKPGQYHICGLDIEVSELPLPDAGEKSCRAEITAPRGDFFAAALPLVIRKAASGDEVLYRGRLCPLASLPGPEKGQELAVVLDRKGIAACFGLAGGDIKDLLYTRDSQDPRGQPLISGGVFAQVLIYSGGFDGEQE
ncbi:MAG: tRNA lysidine(34) synthetase TilS [Spirochaetaceae bacterium]|jgi:tRNA(Ile)-lysidine synthase|nr:tRNA lysidine(34) synthetase TilS [Spirochaetaceae bacterium]